MEIKRNKSNNYIDALCREALTRYNDNLEVVGLPYSPYRSQHYYTILFIPWLAVH